MRGTWQCLTFRRHLINIISATSFNYSSFNCPQFLPEFLLFYGGAWLIFKLKVLHYLKMFIKQIYKYKDHWIGSRVILVSTFSLGVIFLTCKCECWVISVTSDSLRPYGLWPARLLCPWDSPGRILEWVAMPSSRRFSLPIEWTHASYIFCIGRQVLYY